MGRARPFEAQGKRAVPLRDACALLVVRWTCILSLLLLVPAVILGGLDSVIGASVAGLIIGVIESLAQGYLGEGLREIAGFVVIIVVLMIRPFGLFGAHEIERV